jgi:hypothetical protein
MKIKLFTILAITLICANSFAQSSHKTVVELGTPEMTIKVIENMISSMANGIMNYAGVDIIFVNSRQICDV